MNEKTKEPVLCLKCGKEEGDHYNLTKGCQTGFGVFTPPEPQSQREYESKPCDECGCFHDPNYTPCHGQELHQVPAPQTAEAGDKDINMRAILAEQELEALKREHLVVKAGLSAQIQSLRTDLSTAIEEMNKYAGIIKSLRAELEQVKKERDENSKMFNDEREAKLASWKTVSDIRSQLTLIEKEVEPSVAFYESSKQQLATRISNIMKGVEV